MKKTKILFLIGSFDVGGKERQLAEIIKNLPRGEFEIYLIAKSIKAHYLSSSEIVDCLKEFLIVKRDNFKLKDIITIAQFINTINPDVIFSFSTTLAHFGLLAKIFSREHFQLINGSIREAPSILNIKMKIEKLLYSSYKYVVANSYAGLKSYNQLGKKGRFVLYNGMDLNRVPSISKAEARYQLGINPNVFLVTMVSSLRHCFSKDPMTFVKVAEYMQLKDRDIQFYLVGDGSRKSELEDYIHLNQVNNITLTGNRSDVELLFIASDISVLTSKTEGISNSILESMACAVPVIATSGGGTPEIIQNGENGYILPYGDFEAIGKKISELKNNPVLLKVLGENAAKTAREKFSIGALISNLEKILNAIQLSEKKH